MEAKPLVPHWNIESYGTVSRKNTAWTLLVSLLVRRSGKMVEVMPDDMAIGEEGTATFGGCHVPLSRDVIETPRKRMVNRHVAARADAAARRASECKVVRVEDREDTAV